MLTETYVVSDGMTAAAKPPGWFIASTPKPSRRNERKGTALTFWAMKKSNYGVALQSRVAITSDGRG